MTTFKRISTIIVLSSCLLLCNSCGGGGGDGDSSSDSSSSTSGLTLSGHTWSGTAYVDLSSYNSSWSNSVAKDFVFSSGKLVGVTEYGFVSFKRNVTSLGWVTYTGTYSYEPNSLRVAITTSPLSIAFSGYVTKSGSTFEWTNMVYKTYGTSVASYEATGTFYLK